MRIASYGSGEGDSCFKGCHLCSKAFYLIECLVLVFVVLVAVVVLIVIVVVLLLPMTTTTTNATTMSNTLTITTTLTTHALTIALLKLLELPPLQKLTPPLVHWNHPYATPTTNTL